MRSDTAAIAPLEKALAKLESGNASRPTPITDPNKLNLGMYQGAPPGSDWMGETRLLLAYLRADTIENRVAAALAFARDRKIEPTVLREVARQLSANGADPEKCRPLLDQAEQAEKRSGTSR
jgi:predicted S18 family serine protease